MSKFTKFLSVVSGTAVGIGTFKIVNNITNDIPISVTGGSIASVTTYSVVNSSLSDEKQDKEENIFSEKERKQIHRIWNNKDRMI